MKRPASVTAFAYITNDGISIKTVSDTRRSAKVNAIGIHSGVQVKASWTDEAISNFFDDYLASNGWIGEVEVRVYPPIDVDC